MVNKRRSAGAAVGSGFEVNKELNQCKYTAGIGGVNRMGSVEEGVSCER